MLATLVFHPRSKTRSFILLGWFCFILIFHFLAFVKKQSPGMRRNQQRSHVFVSERDHASAELGSRGTRRGNKPVGWVTGTGLRVLALLMWRTRYLCGCVCAPGRPVATNSALVLSHALALSPKLMLGPLPSSTYCTDGCFRRKFADRERV